MKKLIAVLAFLFAIPTYAGPPKPLPDAFSHVRLTDQGGFSGITLQIQNGGSLIGSFGGGVVTLNCSTNTACSISGSTVTLTSTNTASTAFSALTTSDNTVCAPCRIGTGGTLSTTGTGVINSTQLLGSTWAIPGAIGSTTPNTGAFSTVSLTGQLTSTLATGTAPFSVTSTTPVANLSIGGNAATATNATGLLFGATPIPMSATAPTANQCLAADGTAANIIGTACGSGGGGAFPQTVSGTVNAGGFPFFTSTTQLSSSPASSAHSLIVMEGTSNPAFVASPTSNGFYACGFNVTASAAVDPTCTLQGVSLDLTNPATVPASDNLSWLVANSASAYALTGPTLSNNIAYNLFNIGAGAVTETVGSGHWNGGAATTFLIPQWWIGLHVTDNTNPYLASVPTQGSFPSCSGASSALTFNTTTDVFGCNSIAAGGSVTSVALTVPSWLTVTGSPITTSGTLAVAPTAAQTSHQVIGTCGSATTFTPCSLVAGDLPGSGIVQFNGVSATVGGSSANLGQLFDTNGLASISTTTTASQVDALTVVPAATANPAQVALNPTGSDTNIGISMTMKGAGLFDVFGPNSSKIEIGGTGAVTIVSSTSAGIGLNPGSGQSVTSTIGGTAQFKITGGNAADQYFTLKDSNAAPTGDPFEKQSSTGTVHFSIGPNGIPGLGQTCVISAADYTNSTTTPSTVCSFTLPPTVAAKTYIYDCDFLWESTAATLTGPTIGLNLSAAPTQLTGLETEWFAVAGTFATGYLSNTTTGSQTLLTGTAAGATATNYPLKIEGTIEGAPTAGSTFIINAAALSNTTSTLNIRRGSSCKITALP